MSTIVPLVYTVDRDRKYGKYIAFLHPKAFKRLKLPYVIKDEFSSLSATYPWSFACACKGNVELIHIENYFFHLFQEQFKQHWDYTYGIPTIYFKGKLDTFSEETQRIPIFLLTFTKSIDPLYQLTYWEEAIVQYTHPCVLADIIDNNAILITDKLAMKKYLRTKMMHCIRLSLEE